MEGMVGEIRLFAGKDAPKNWAFCQGQIISISGNEALYAILSDYYGGDRTNNFALPDLRGRIPRDVGFSIFQGVISGQEQAVIPISAMPSHTHTATVSKDKLKIPVSSNAPSSPSPANAFLTEQSTNYYASSSSSGKYYGQIQGTVSLDIGETGKASPINNMQPSLAMNYIICVQGIFPARN